MKGELLRSVGTFLVKAAIRYRINAKRARASREIAVGYYSNCQAVNLILENDLQEYGLQGEILNRAAVQRKFDAIALVRTSQEIDQTAFDPIYTKAELLLVLPDSGQVRVLPIISFQVLAIAINIPPTTPRNHIALVIRLLAKSPANRNIFPHWEIVSVNSHDQSAPK